MKDNIDYFTHSCNSHRRPELKALKAVYGFEGVGRYWTLDELIGDSPNCKLDLTKKVFFNETAGELGMSPVEFEEFLTFLCDPEECGLIHNQDGILTSRQTQEDLSRVEKTREKGRKKYNSKTSLEKSDSSREKDDSSREAGYRAEQSRLEQININQQAILSTGEPQVVDNFAAAEFLKSAGITVTDAELSAIKRNLADHDLDAGFIDWAVTEAKTRGNIRNAQGFTKRILQDPGSYSDWLEAYRSRPVPLPDRPRYSGECPECGGLNHRELAGDNGNPECWCQDCKSVIAVWDNDFEMWRDTEHNPRNSKNRASPG